MSQKSDKQVTLVNTRKHVFHTKKGPFKPGHENAMPFDEDEAKQLLGYEGVFDASKFVPAGTGDARVAELEAKVAELEADLEKKSGAKELKAANKALEEANARIAELEAKLAE